MAFPVMVWEREPRQVPNWGYFGVVEYQFNLFGFEACFPKGFMSGTQGTRIISLPMLFPGRIDNDFSVRG